MKSIEIAELKREQILVAGGVVRLVSAAQLVGQRRYRGVLGLFKRGADTEGYGGGALQRRHPV